jgi:hypothetical protein
MQGCFDCGQGIPLVKTGKAYQKDLHLYECDNPSCKNKVCRGHLVNLYTLGDFCGCCAKRERSAANYDIPVARVS